LFGEICLEETVLALQKDIGCFLNIRCLKILVGATGRLLLHRWNFGNTILGLFSPTVFITDRHRMSGRHPMSGKTLVWWNTFGANSARPAKRHRMFFETSDVWILHWTLCWCFFSWQTNFSKKIL